MITVTPKELKDNLIDCINHDLVPIVHGSPGIAKSAIVHQTASELDYRLIDIRLSQLDPTDLNGLVMLGEGNRSCFAPSNLFPLEGDTLDKPVLLFFDELGQANPSVMNAALKVILDRQIGLYKLHPDVKIVAATNKITDRANVNKLPTPLSSRLIHFELTINIKDWINWASRNDIDHRIISYLNYQNDALYTFNPTTNEYTYACPRTWEFLSKIIKDKPELTDKDLPIITGCIGESTGIKFETFTRIYADLPNKEEILSDPENANIPEASSSVYALAGYVGSWLASDNCTTAMKYITRLGVEYQVICLKIAIAKNPDIIEEEPILDWVSENACKLGD